jgi:hypothetical protein
MPEESIAWDLFKCHVTTLFKRALAAHDVLSQAYLERTGEVLQPDSDYTVEDLRRASRLLRTNYDRDGNEK